ncbi:heparan-alpha-glucosaminide N-acetyltransferase [Marinomonas posidonica]|uniref:heparan-alpha-glucosaminide N-acetyltransferase n=1 Tax=Marinomonas posidonica TaxID=936476 RepID=UPI0037350D45
MLTSAVTLPYVPAAKKRSLFLDAYRGCAVALMIVFHFCWDLRNFDFLQFSIHDPFWVYFRSLILTLFLTAVGWSGYLTRQSQQPNTFWRRDLKLFIAAAAISLATYLAAPTQWIYFGILHFILLASLLTRPLLRWPILSALLGALILYTYHFTDWLLFPNAFDFIQQHFFALPTRTLDIVFPFPWIGVVLIGPLLGYLGWHTFSIGENIAVKILAFMGQYALPIYLLHQVILFSAVASFKMVLEWFY